MRGIKTDESRNFLAFFQKVQEAAKMTQSVFFLFSGEGNETESGNLELSDLSGWLIPENKADHFEKVWRANRSEELDNWSDFFLFAFWKGNPANPTIEFKSY